LNTVNNKCWARVPSCCQHCWCCKHNQTTQNNWGGIHDTGWRHVIQLNSCLIMTLQCTALLNITHTHTQTDVLTWDSSQGGFHWAGPESWARTAVVH